MLWQPWEANTTGNKNSSSKLYNILRGSFEKIMLGRGIESIRQVAILNRVIREDFAEKVIFEPRVKGSDGDSQANI